MENIIRKLEIDGAKLQAFRNKKHLTQQEVADLLGVSKQLISNYECNEATPPGNVLARLMVIYEINHTSEITNLA